MAESNREEITKLEALYASNPGGRVFTHLAEAYRKAGNLTRARTILEQGISKHSDSASAHVVLGRVLSDLGAHEEAAVSYRRVLTLDPENRVALRSLGDLSRRAGEAHAALGYYRQLQHLDPSDEELGATIQELTQEASRPAAAPAEATPRTPAGAWMEPKPAAAEPSATATTVTPDFSLDWADQEEEEGLPGDLAHLARSQTARAAEPLVAMPNHPPEVSFPPDIPDRDGTTGRVLEPAPPVTEPFEPATTSLGEMEMQPASEAVEFAAEQEEQLAPQPSFEDLLSREPGGVAPLAAAAEEPELPTETLADLYRSQGFNDRAAEVYRTLLERKPGDPEVERKLAEVEALLQPIAEPEVPARVEPEFEAEVAVTDEPWAVAEELRQEEVLAAASEEPAAIPAEEPEVMAGDAWLEGVASGWTETAPAAGAETPYAWKDEAAEDQSGGPTLGSYLQKVLSWKPTRTETPANSQLNTAPITLGYADATGTPAASPGIPNAPKAEARTETPETDGPASSPIVGLEPPVPMPDEGEVPRATGPRETASPEPPVIDDTAPAQVIGRTELSPPPPITPAPPTPSPRPAAGRAASGNAIDDAFDEWFTGGETPPPSAPPSPAVSPAASGPAGSARPEASADTTETDDESDDDLEMFRSWLQSLKR